MGAAVSCSVIVPLGGVVFFADFAAVSRIRILFFMGPFLLCRSLKHGNFKEREEITNG